MEYSDVILEYLMTIVDHSVIMEYIIVIIKYLAIITEYLILKLCHNYGI